MPNNNPKPGLEVVEKTSLALKVTLTLGMISAFLVGAVVVTTLLPQPSKVQKVPQLIEQTKMTEDGILQTETRDAQGNLISFKKEKKISEVLAKATTLQDESINLPDNYGYIIELKDLPVLTKDNELKEQLRAKKITTSQKKTAISEYEQQLSDNHIKAKADFERILVRKIPKEKIIGEHKKVSNNLVLDIPQEEALKLKQSEYVKDVYPNNQVKAMATTSENITSENNNLNPSELDLTGEGVTIAIIDTGVDYTHPDLGACFIPEITETCFPDEEARTGDCIDTDGGLNYCVPGRVVTSTGHINDVCLNNIRLQEVYCKEDGSWANTVYYDCPLGCANGMCLLPDNDINAGGCAKVIGGYDFVTCAAYGAGGCIFPKGEDPDPKDDHGHGTHVASIAAGDGVLKGTAPKAKLYAYKVLNSQGMGWTSWIISGIERAIDPNQDGDFSDHVDIINLSLGGAITPGDPLSRSVDAAVEAGVVVVAAAGNSYDYKTIGSPAISKKAITVGAAEGQDMETSVIADFSSKGPANVKEFYLKPDLVAPGVGICAARSSVLPGRDAWGTYYCIDNKHITLSGTSMASPYVAGMAALLKQKYPAFSPEEIKSLITLGGLPTKINQYKGHLYYSNSARLPDTSGTEFCTKVNIDVNVDQAKAKYTSLFTQNLDKAILRNDSNSNPGAIAQEATWSLVGRFYEAEFPPISKGTYWLCASFSQTTYQSYFKDEWGYCILNSGSDRFYNEVTGKFEIPTCDINMILGLQYTIPSRVYDEGSGLVDFAKSVDSPITTSPANLSFGIVNNSSQKELNIKNISKYSVDIRISPSSSQYSMDLNKRLKFDEYNYVNVDSNTISISSQGTGVITANVSVPVNAAEGYYSGKINLTVNTILGPITYGVPYSFLVVRETTYDAPERSSIPTIDGVINNTEWADAKHYSGLGSNKNVDLYLKSGKKDGKDTLFIAMKSPTPNDNYYLYFDEGDNGLAGGGTYDRVLTLNQDDSKLGRYEPLDGYYESEGVWFWEGRMNPGSHVDFDYKLNVSANGTELELTMPFVGTDIVGGPMNDRSDINITYGESVGFGFSFANSIFPDKFDDWDALTWTAKIKTVKCSENNVLINCDVCGCPTNLPYCNQTSKQCEAKCLDGTPFGKCSGRKPLYCNNQGKLTSSCLLCGCLAGQQCKKTTGFPAGQCIGGIEPTPAL